MRFNDAFQLDDVLVRKAMCEGFGHVAVIASTCALLRVNSVKQSLRFSANHNIASPLSYF
ncbi:MAG: hypothetical protein NG747_07165 [Candidatus Brocadia sp.]|nr:hypothetical protein [Candidatus Brocadia sp.]